MEKSFLVVITVLFAALPSVRAAELVLNNGLVTVKTNNAYGGAITWIAPNGLGNWVNLYDHGRLIQQSYYAGSKLNRQAQGQSPAWSPWQWNPVQGGSFNGNASTVSTFTATNNVLYSWTTPKLWDMPNEAAQAVMKQWTEFEPGKTNVIRVTNQLVCLRSANDLWGGTVNYHQELPAIYLIRALSTAKIYNGAGSWSNYTLPTLSASGWGRPNPPKKIMAYFLPGGQGLGIYSPKANTAWNSGVVGTSASTMPTSPDTVHVAPLATVALARNSTYTFRYWLVVGDQAAITTRMNELLILYPNG